MMAEIRFIENAYKVNLELFHEGLKSPRTTFARHLLKLNGGKEISEDEHAIASLMCNAAIEARVIGLDKPAMSITGSGAHGIIATIPLYAAYKVNGYTEEQLLRATALSYLVCISKNIPVDCQHSAAVRSQRVQGWHAPLCICAAVR